MVGRIGNLAGAALIATATAGSAVAASDDPLAAHLWTSRVLVIAAPEADDARLRAQREALASARGGVKERDLVVIEAVGSGKQAAALRQRLGLSEGAFRAVLVGKDGGPKLSSAEPIPPQTLFATIDAMPMRRDEMKRR
ncbi:DUF4174 domain-containing protein [Methylobacterium gnaphalii]|uniref:DUF4174 domain-containing protein n=1 Tax=Methylobacterium gnaphalii TaxID=1010610 RepID=A0A512JI95_9HYPH|nr:DUF4174 domain-containing protein [Methylobacterium gnaphalii]GEP09643.1 hypothetical protein MGN01_14880 [Methylobacterium gnaphalii]GJD67769.1 hypothetical protein MMMDOFMJ_0685 [Methylobacterium gnaphalii]GLS50062.1 hypothetical protein GCM10007885_29140 [Methylobacterium gnaphalii]